MFASFTPGQPAYFFVAPYLFMKAGRSLLSGALLALTSLSQGLAQDVEKKAIPVRLLLGGALELGGDRVAEVYFTNGNTQSVRAGQGGSVAVGAEFAVPQLERLRLRATVGYKYVTTEADNAHIRLTRVPVQLTGNWMLTDQLRAGAGVALHRGIKFTADGIGPDITFKGAAGPTFDLAYRGIGLMYTAMSYTDQFGKKYAANAFGLAFTGVLPRR